MAFDTIPEMLLGHARNTPDAPAIASPGHETLTYAALVGLVEQTGRALAGSGIGRGDRVILISSGRPVAVTAYLALACHTTVVPASPDLTDGEFRDLLERVRATAVCFLERDIRQGVHIPQLVLHPHKDGAAGAFTMEGTAGAPEARAQSVTGDNLASIILTSGTTSRPKAVPLRHRMILRRAVTDATHLGLRADDVCMNFRAPNMSGPLNAALMPALVTNGCVVVPQQFDVDAVFRAFKEFSVTWYTGGPAHHSALLAGAERHKDMLRSSRLRLVRTAGYFMPEQLKQQLVSTFGVICVEKYGGTETGPLAGYPLSTVVEKSGTVGTVLDGELDIRGPDGAVMAPGMDGEIFVRGPGVFDGYFDDDALNAKVFHDGWYATGDLGRLDRDGFLTISGRLSEVVNCGGFKISPEEVEEALFSAPGVSDCLCFGVPHATLGQQLVVAVVAKKGAELSPVALREHLLQRLSPQKVPSVILNWVSVPRTVAGKPLRRQAVERFQESGAPASAPEGATDPVVEKLRQIWAEVLGHGPGEDENFFVVGGDSLRAVELFARIKAEFGVELEFDVIFEAGATIKGMAGLLAEGAGAGRRRGRRQKWLTARTRASAAVRIAKNFMRGRPLYDRVRFDDTVEFSDVLERLELAVRGWPGTRLKAKVPIFALNEAGSLPPLVWCFNAAKEPPLIASLLGPDQPVLALRSMNMLVRDRGLRNRFSSMAASLYADGIDQLLPRGPLAVGGNCQAGMIAEQVALQIARRDREVVQLSLIDAQPRQPYPGRVAMIFGADADKHNPFLKDTRADKAWAGHGEAVWDIIPGTHGEYLTPEIGPVLAKRLKKRLEEAHKSVASAGIDRQRPATLRAMEAGE